MRHCRIDYEAIQPWPTKRPHWAKDENGDLFTEPLDLHASEWCAGSPIIPDDEPVFVLRAKDSVGPDCVRDWCRRAGERGADQVTVRRVLAWADEMDAWAAANGGPKLADTPAHLLRPSEDSP